MGSGAPVTVLVDGNNVIGTRPDGWWRDRAGAARSLLARLQCFARDDGAVSVEVVFDVVPPDLGAGVHEGVLVHTPARRGATPLTTGSSSCWSSATRRRWR